MKRETLFEDLPSPCPACQLPLLKGQDWLMFPIGPGNDGEARARRDAGQSYNAVAIVMHWDCASRAIQESK